MSTSKNKKDFKQIDFDIDQLEYCILNAEKTAASLLSSLVWDTDNEIKNEKNFYQGEMIKNTLAIFNEIRNLKNRLKEIKSDYKYGSKETEQDEAEEPTDEIGF